MKLILRKNDSATSLILFIFNNYMIKTGKDYFRLSSLLEILRVFGKSETAIRMSLSRAVKSGLLLNSKFENEIIYSLTSRGKNAVNIWNEGVMNFWKRYQLRSSDWNNMWYFINIEFTDNSMKRNAELFDKLQQQGLAQLNMNTWVTPYHQNNDIRNLIEKYDLKNGVTEIYGEMRIHKDMDKFLDETFGINMLQVSYKKFTDEFGKKLSEIKLQSNTADFTEKGLALPILHELGWKFFGIASEDAALPKQILPDWEGDKAALIMKEMREILSDASFKYLEKFDY